MEESLIDEALVDGQSKEAYNFWQGVLLALLVFAGQFLGVVIGAIITYFIKGAISGEHMNLVMILGMIIGFPIAAFLVMKFRSLDIGVLKWNNSYLILLPFGLMMSYGTSYIIGGLLEYLPGYDAMLDDYLSMFEGLDPLMLFIAGAIVGPICEELIFRGVILKEFLKKYSPNIAILLSAIIFGAIHLIHIQVISAFFVGLVLGWIYYKTKNLWVPILIHIVNNSIAFLIGLDEVDQKITDYFDNQAMYYGSFLIAALVIYSGYMLFTRFNPKQSITV